jgi:hypothetical protein
MPTEAQLAARFKPGNDLGRRPGTPNRVTSELRKGIMFAYQGLGGAEFLLDWARKNPSLFLTKVLMRMLPYDVNADANVHEVYRDIAEVNDALQRRALPMARLESVLFELEQERQEREGSNGSIGADLRRGKMDDSLS